MENQKVKHGVKPSLPTHTVLLMGDSRVGKSSIIARYCYNHFPYSYNPAWDHDTKDIVLPNGTTNRLELEDFSTFATPDQPFDLRTRVIQTTDSYIIVYDITNLATLEKVKSIHAEVRGSGSNKPVVILGNKCDDSRRREVSEAEGRKIARELRCRFAEVSAKRGMGIEEVFLALATEIVNQKRLEKQLETNAAGCNPFSLDLNVDLGRVIVDAVRKVDKWMDMLHAAILRWMYGPDHLLREAGPAPRCEVIRHEVPRPREVEAETVQERMSSVRNRLQKGGRRRKREKSDEKRAANVQA